MTMVWLLFSLLPYGVEREVFDKLLNPAELLTEALDVLEEEVATGLEYAAALEIACSLR